MRPTRLRRPLPTRERDSKHSAPYRRAPLFSKAVLHGHHTLFHHVSSTSTTSNGDANIARYIQTDSQSRHRAFVAHSC